MTVNKLIAVMIMWIVAQFLCLSVNGALFGAAGEGGWRDMLNHFTLISIVTGNQSWSVLLDNPLVFFQDLWSVISFDYPCFTGYLFIVRLILMGLSIGLIWGLVSTFRGANS